MTKPAAGTNTWQPLYRALLRSSSASVRFSRPAARNTQRYLRDDFAAALTSSSHLQTGLKANSVRQLTANTLAFHLSASLHVSGSGQIGVSSPVPPSHATQIRHAIQPNGTSHPKVGKRGRLAHRIISNLSSLTYHHLSPYTQMQSPRSAHLRAALRKPKKLSSLARVLGKLDTPTSSDLPDGTGGETNLHSALEGEEGGMLNLAHMKLSFLMPTPKPIRGPKEAKLKNWDGQDPVKIGSEGSLRQMQEDLATVERLLQENGNQRGGDKGVKTGVQQLKDEAETLRKKIKAAAKALVQAEEKREMENVGIEALAELIAGAQDRERVMLGKQRWAKRARGEFLSP